MKRYAVAYINFFDNELKMSIQEATNEVDACRKHLWNKDATEQENVWIILLGETLEDIKDSMFNMDSQINAIEI